MTNDEYQRQAREQQRRDDEARFRRRLEDYARSQRERQAREAESSRRAYSRRLGEMGAPPPIFGGGVDSAAYRQGQQAHDARKKATESSPFQFSFPNAPAAAPRTFTSGGGVKSGSAKKSSGGMFFFLCLLIGFAYLSTSHEPSKPPAPVEAKMQSTPPLAPEPQAFGPPQNVSIPWPTEGETYAAGHEGWDGCRHGELALGTSGMTFTCADDSQRNFSYELAQIEGADKDGMQLVSGKKFHFQIAGQSKQQTEVLFQQWLYRTRLISR